MSFYRFQVGQIPCFAVSAGEAWFRAQAFFANAPQDELRLALQHHGIEGDTLLTPMNCLLLQLHGQTILIDTGMGGTTLAQNLHAAGFSVDDIHLVILSHLHSDHAGGLMDSSGKLIFTKARLLVSEEELAANPERVRQFEAIPSTCHLFPEVEILPAPGHTPGQIAIKISSEGQRLIYTADTLAHPIHLEHPDWHILSDANPNQAVDSRRRMLAHLSEPNVRAFIYHFPFPGIFTK